MPSFGTQFKQYYLLQHGADHPSSTPPRYTIYQIMQQPNSKVTPYARKTDCLAWALFVKENWTPPNEGNVSPKEQRLELMRQWENAEQDFRDIYIHRARNETYEDDLTDYLPDIPAGDFRRKLEHYPCIRASYNEADRNKWDKLELFLKLDDTLSPLHESELPPIIADVGEFQIEDYARKFILQDANFRLMGMSNFGQPVFYYHILMVVDEQAFRDGTLLHLDFNRSGDLAHSFRYPAIDSFLPWMMHMNSQWDLGMINEQFYDRAYLPNGVDLTRPTLAILKEEMESRGVHGEGISIESLAREAIEAVNPRLLHV